ncbi:hypothetical protein FRC10_002094 [Ceratobasidium sp. 414]|nr:hypothetical protein FRC10_002094 [Ceratobasidium sp. 414]
MATRLSVTGCSSGATRDNGRFFASVVLASRNQVPTTVGNMIDRKFISYDNVLYSGVYKIFNIKSHDWVTMCLRTGCLKPSPHPYNTELANSANHWHLIPVFGTPGDVSQPGAEKLINVPEATGWPEPRPTRANDTEGASCSNVLETGPYYILNAKSGTWVTLSAASIVTLPYPDNGSTVSRLHAPYFDFSSALIWSQWWIQSDANTNTYTIFNPENNVYAGNQDEQYVVSQTNVSFRWILQPVRDSKNQFL